MDRKEIVNSQDYKATEAALEWWYSLPEEQRKATDIDAEPDIVDAYSEGVIYGWNNPNWFSIEDELPPVDEDYVEQGFAEPDEEGNTLTVSTTVLVTDGKYVETTFYIFELKRWNSQMDDTKITHWMPLPAAPRKEEKE